MVRSERWGFASGGIEPMPPRMPPVPSDGSGYPRTNPDTRSPKNGTKPLIFGRYRTISEEVVVREQEKIALLCTRYGVDRFTEAGEIA